MICCRYFWPLFVLTELLVLLIIVLPCFVRRAMRPVTFELPVTDKNGGGAAPHPYAPRRDAAIQPTYC